VVVSGLGTVVVVEITAAISTGPTG
jgi:hypothetical protein